MLAVRGVGPGAIGAKALLESLLAALLGAAAGFGVAVLLVRAIGPSSVLDGAAIADGARRTAIGLAIGLVLLGVVAGVRSRTLGTRRTRRARLPLAWLPWEAVPLLLAWWSHRRLQAMGSPVADGTDIPDVDLLALAFPLLFIVGTVALAARLATAALRLLRDRGQRWPTWLFLAGRRLGATSHLAVILLAASATAVGVFVYAGTLTHTLDVTLDAKAQTARGSDVVVETVGPPTVPAAYRDRATVVRALIDTQISSPQVDVIAVDPATFDRGVLWDPSFADESLDTLLGRLDRPTTAAGLPAILVNGGLPPGDRLDFVDPRYPDLQIEPGGHGRGLPGRQPGPSAGGGLDRRAGGRAEPAGVTGVDRRRRRRRQPGVRPGRQPGAVPHHDRGRARPDVVPHRGLDLRVHAGPGRARGSDHRRRAAALPRHAAAGETGVLRLPAPHGAHPAGAPALDHRRGRRGARRRHGARRGARQRGGRARVPRRRPGAEAAALAPAPVPVEPAAGRGRSPAWSCRGSAAGSRSCPPIGATWRRCCVPRSDAVPKSDGGRRWSGPTT